MKVSDSAIGDLPMENESNRSSVSAGDEISTSESAGVRSHNISLDYIAWEAINDIARRERLSVTDLLSSIQRSAKNKNLKSAMRLFILQYYRGTAARSLQ
jgi:predicted DNA-binding ribbon-helix-helix protein